MNARSGETTTGREDSATGGVAALADETMRVTQDQAVEVAGEKQRKVRSYVDRDPHATVGLSSAARALLLSWLRS